MRAAHAPQIQVRRVSAHGVRELRHRVLWPHKRTAAECTIDIDDAPDAIHLGAFYDEAVPWGIDVNGVSGRLVGACSLFAQHCLRMEVPWEHHQGLRLRVMGTLPEARGCGAGAALIQRASFEVQSQGRHMLWCDAREVAFGFYERMGFVFLNDTYDIPDIGPHRTMALDVSLLPHL